MALAMCVPVRPGACAHVRARVSAHSSYAGGKRDHPTGGKTQEGVAVAVSHHPTEIFIEPTCKPPFPRKISHNPQSNLLASSLNIAIMLFMNNDLKQIAEAIMDAMSRVADEQAHIKDLYIQAKSKGYDVKVLRKAIGLIVADKIEKAKEEIALLDLYLDNLGQMRLL
jgi:uncharacterized protein (UPF0335 family)